MPYIEEALLVLVRLWRAAALFVIAWIVLLVWLSVRRTERRALALAIPMWAAAAVLFLVAVSAPRPALSETVATGLVVVSAALVIGGVAALMLSARRPRPVVKHRGPPWEDGGW